MTNHFLHFLALERADPKKFQVLQIIAALLGWTDGTAVLSVRYISRMQLTYHCRAARASWSRKTRSFEPQSAGAYLAMVSHTKYSSVIHRLLPRKQPSERVASRAVV